EWGTTAVSAIPFEWRWRGGRVGSFDRGPVGLGRCRSAAGEAWQGNQVRNQVMGDQPGTARIRCCLLRAGPAGGLCRWIA
ncbi:MAG: hypothetical protein ACKOFW_07630, partial [Planctomycetaceae bacterium]